MREEIRTRSSREAAKTIKKLCWSVNRSRQSHWLWLLNRNMEYQFMYYARYRRRKIYCFEQCRQVLGEEDMEEALKDAVYHSSRSIIPSDLSEKMWVLRTSTSGIFRKNLQEKAGKIRRFLEVLKSMKTWKKSEKNKLSLIEKLLYY